ncbi:hypothetical protein LIER_38716 [Lithospermum erythrorhizon]|uniref:Uncharacterized protein n=1 Tax=Lithospermum erythrorhizon TaxID=34254 RepID=A0AAV3Q5P3_LITER
MGKKTKCKGRAKTKFSPMKKSDFFQDMETPPRENTKFAAESSCKFNEVADVFNEFKKVSLANSFGNFNSGDEIDCEVKDG